MRYTQLALVLAVALVACGAGCSKEEDTTAEAKKYSPEMQKLRKKIFRAGTVTRALDDYRMAIGAYPSTKQGLAALLERPDGLAHPEYWTGPYLKNEDDLIDEWGNEFKYVFPGKTHEGKYDIISFGPDGQEGTDDDILNWDIR